MLRDRSLIPLSHQHQHALGMCVLVQRALAADESAENLERQRAVILEKWQEEIQAHFAVEETVLFPTMAAFPATAALVDDLSAEHQMIREWIRKLEIAPDRAVMESLCTLLPEHVRKEEQVLFEQTQQLLSREQLDELGARLGMP